MGSDRETTNSAGDTIIEHLDDDGRVVDRSHARQNVFGETLRERESDGRLSIEERSPISGDRHLRHIGGDPTADARARAAESGDGYDGYDGGGGGGGGGGSSERSMLDHLGRFDWVPGVLLLIAIGYGLWRCGQWVDREVRIRPSGSASHAPAPEPNAAPPGPAPAPAAGPMCGEPGAFESDDGRWSEYSCVDRADAGKRWRRCLARREYTEERARGCPGDQCCCPP